MFVAILNGIKSVQMADIKTILRETSVVFGITETPIDKISIKDYVEHLKYILKNYSKVSYELNKLYELDNDKWKECIGILVNGYKIGESIRNSIRLNGDIVWMGADVNYQYPFDLMIGDFGISLKEHSYILKNPALSDYINSLTQFNPPFKTIHIFRHFAHDLFEEWFNYTLKRLFEKTKDGIVFKNDKRNCQLIREGDDLIFTNETTSIVLNRNKKINESEFNRQVGGYFIEHTFSKWINANMDEDIEYIRLKKLCSETAGNNFKIFIQENLNINKKSILSLFQIYDRKYLFAKTGTPPILLEVPSFNDVDVELVSIEVLVPKSQLNVYFKFEFNANGKKSIIKVRVECRYSHGQFKGVPEAKLYYTDNDEISNIYKRIVSC